MHGYFIHFDPCNHAKDKQAKDSAKVADGWAGAMLQYYKTTVHQNFTHGTTQQSLFESSITKNKVGLRTSLDSRYTLVTLHSHS